MAPAILLVDDQRDVLRLLHSVLDTLQQPELEILETVSGEEALEEIARRHVELMVLDYRLPGMTGVEVMHKARAEQPEIKVILITGTSDRKARSEMLNAGAAAVFDKPVPLADFLDIVEKSLGFQRTIFATESEEVAEASAARLPDLLVNLRQDLQASAVFLTNERGLVVARAGDLRDTSTEVSLISALTASASAGLRIAKANRQEGLDQFSVFSGGDHDLVLMPVDATYSLLLAGNDLTVGDDLVKTIKAMRAVRTQLGQSLRSIGLPKDSTPTLPRHPEQTSAGETDTAASAPEIEDLFKVADEQKLEAQELDAFWDQAANRHTNRSSDPDVISYEEARKLGLTPDER